MINSVNEEKHMKGAPNHYDKRKPPKASPLKKGMPFVPSSLKGV